jgi:hypothetical protein
MIEIRNKNRFPVQLVIRSRTSPRAFTTLNVPGIGKGKNICLLEDELMTEYVQRVESMGLISTRHIQNQLEAKGV